MKIKYKGGPMLGMSTFQIYIFQGVILCNRDLDVFVMNFISG